MCQGVYIYNMARKDITVDLAKLFTALSDPTRLRLLNLMNGREVCVCYFVEILQQGQPKISRHLAYLRSSGLVTARREGKWMHYSLALPKDPKARAVLEQTLQSLQSDRTLQADSRKLKQACCRPGKFISLAAAPVPSVR